MELTTILREAVGDFSVILLLMLIDLVTGVTNSLLNRREITSSRLKGSATKMIIYFAIISIAVVCSAFGTEGVKKLLIGYVALIESLSVIENLSGMFPKNRLLAKITSKLQVLKKKSDKE